MLTSDMRRAFIFIITCRAALVDHPTVSLWSRPLASTHNSLLFNPNDQLLIPFSECFDKEDADQYHNS